MTVPDDLAGQLRSVRSDLDELDQRRDQLIARRDQLILEARDAGGSLREIAELLGLSHMAVQHVVQRDSSDGP